MSFEDIAIPEGSTSLLVGAQSGNLALVRHALATEGRADPAEYVNRGNIVGETPLHVASMNHDPDEDAPITADVKRRNQVEITRLLLDAGASTETRTDLAGETPLLRAVMDVRPDILAVLISANADVNAHDRHGFAPLHMAVLEEQQPGGFSTNHFGSGESGRTIIRMLLAAGADVNTRLLEFSDKNYTPTPMEIAITGNCVRLWPILLRAGATLPQDVPRFSDPYLERIRELGSFSAYEKAHRQSFVALLAPKFPRLPVDALSHVVSFWAHVGDY